jgi:hypothetical protein
MATKPENVAIGTINRLIGEGNVQKYIGKRVIRTVGRVIEASGGFAFGRYAIIESERTKQTIMVLFEEGAVDAKLRPYVGGMAEVIGVLDFRKILKEEKWVIVASSIRSA